MTLQIDSVNTAELIGERPGKPGKNWWRCGEIWALPPRKNSTTEEIKNIFLSAIEAENESGQTE